MVEPIFDPIYWQRRLEQSRNGLLFHSVFRCGWDRWKAIGDKHQQILRKYIQPQDNILDCGCGYGRLLELMPFDWIGGYLGLDLSPDFVALAQETWTDKLFNVADLRGLSGFMGQWDWAILVSVRPMIRRNCGANVWQQMESEIRKKAKRLLYLEYDPDDDGSVE